MFVVFLAIVVCVALALLVLLHVGWVKQGREVPYVPQLGEWMTQVERRLTH